MDDSIICQALGKRVHSLRLQRRITQDILAERAEIHRNYCSDIERGKRNPSLTVIFHIASSLDLKMHDLFNDDFDALLM